ncbi:MAG: PAS domain-containing protein [Ferrovibrio sp.]
MHQHLPDSPAAAASAELIWSPQPGDFRTAAAAAIHRYWLDQRQGGRLPGRSDIDPLAMRAALGNIALLEVQHDPVRFRLRLVGTYQVSRLGFDPTGMWLDEMPAPEYRALLISRLQAILERPEPLLVRNRQLMDDRWYDYETIWLPMANDGERIDMVMACQIFADAPQGG